MSLPTCYAVTYIRLVEEARKLGYALTLHGSMKRDLDLVAVPWSEDAVPARELAEAIREEAGGYMAPLEAEDRYHQDGQPGSKPHGRLCWSFHLGGGPYIDLSVMPRTHPAWPDMQPCTSWQPR